MVFTASENNCDIAKHNKKSIGIERLIVPTDSVPMQWKVAKMHDAAACLATPISGLPGAHLTGHLGQLAPWFINTNLWNHDASTIQPPRCPFLRDLCDCHLHPGFFAASPHQPAPPVMRLGDAVKPLAYDAELSIVPGADQFNGKITIDVELTKAQNFFWLNADKIDVKKMRD
ncbi:hypothetical protein ACFS07_14185 [Undibacterium arcticum]